MMSVVIGEPLYRIGFAPVLLMLSVAFVAVFAYVNFTFTGAPSVSVKFAMLAVFAAVSAAVLVTA